MACHASHTQMFTFHIEIAKARYKYWLGQSISQFSVSFQFETISQFIKYEKHFPKM